MLARLDPARAQLLAQDAAEVPAPRAHVGHPRARPVEVREQRAHDLGRARDGEPLGVHAPPAARLTPCGTPSPGDARRRPRSRAARSGPGAASGTDCTRVRESPYV